MKMAGYLSEYKDDEVFREFRRELLSRECTNSKQLNDLITRLGIKENESWIDFVDAMDSVEVKYIHRRNRRGKFEENIFNLSWNEDNQ